MKLRCLLQMLFLAVRRKLSSPTSKHKVLIVLNTDFHTETAISLYLSLSKIPGIFPEILETHNSGDKRGFFAFCSLHRISILKSYSSPRDREAYRHAFLVSFYPKQPIHNHGHPVMMDFADRISYVSHRCNSALQSCDPSKVFTLSPLSKSLGFDSFSQMDSPVKSLPIFKKLVQFLRTEPRYILVQGKFEIKHRNEELLHEILKQVPDPRLRILMLGSKIPNVFKNNPRVICKENVSEEEFYQACSEADFILPLVDDKIRNASYAKERFSSSIGISYMFALPVISHSSIFKIYGSPGIQYEDDLSCIKAVTTALNMPWWRYCLLKYKYLTLLRVLNVQNHHLLMRCLGPRFWSKKAIGE